LSEPIEKAHHNSGLTGSNFPLKTRKPLRIQADKFCLGLYNADLFSIQ
jgi:hypothetical protein